MFRMCYYINNKNLTTANHYNAIFRGKLSDKTLKSLKGVRQ